MFSYRFWSSQAQFKKVFATTSFKKYIHLIFSCFSRSTQQFHQASEPVLHLHQHMANSRWIHTSGKCGLVGELGLNIC